MTAVVLRPSESFAVRWQGGKWNAVAQAGAVRVAIHGVANNSCEDALRQALTALRVTVDLAEAIA